MDAYTDGYVEFVLEQLTQAKLECADPLVLIEQRLDFSCWVPEGFGTGDCLIVADKLLHIIDFKYAVRVCVHLVTVVLGHRLAGAHLQSAAELVFAEGVGSTPAVRLSLRHY